MPVKLEVKGEDSAVKAQREVFAQRVIDYFKLYLPNSRLLCFLDDEDPPVFVRDLPRATRGFFKAIHDDADLTRWPQRIRDCVWGEGHVTALCRAVDDLVYLFGRTCVDEVGLTMTLAHELQHAVQHAEVRKLWAANSLVEYIDEGVTNAVKLKPANIPIEREARIVSKRAAEYLHGDQRVRQFIDRKIAERISEGDVEDWQFIRTLKPSDAVDLARDTQLLFDQLRDFRSELENALREARTDNYTDFMDLDLNGLLGPSHSGPPYQS